MRTIKPNYLSATTSLLAAITCYGTPGDVDLSFDSGASLQFTYYDSTAVQSDGKILIGGAFSSIQSVSRTNLARLYPDGTLDTGFLSGMSGASGRVSGIVIQPQDSKILIWGDFTSINESPRPGLARLNPDGILDTNFLPVFGSSHGINSVKVDGNGKILIGGSFTQLSGIARTNLARLNTDGSLDTSFLNGMSGPNAYVSSIVLQKDTKILVAGVFTTFNGEFRTNVARLNPDGTLDPSFVPSFSSAFASIGPWSPMLGLQNDGKIIMGLGYYSDLPSPGEWCRVLRLNRDGSTDNAFSQATGFNQGGRVSLYSLALQGDDRILFAGIFNTVNGLPRTDIARLNSDGTLDTTFNAVLTGSSSFNSTLGQVLLQPDGRILIVGAFSSVNGVPRQMAARLVGGPYFLDVGTPVSQTAESGTTVRIGIDASGYTLPTYQWFFNDTLLPNETNPVLQLNQVSSLNSGSYTVLVTNSTGSVTSNPAMLNVIPPVETSIVPAVKVSGVPGTLVHLEYTESLNLPAWQDLVDMTLTTNSYYFDLDQPLPTARFFRTRHLSTITTSPPECQMSLVPALTLNGNIGHSIQVDYINRIGPTNAWLNLGSVVLTNITQLYFDVSAPGQPPRLYRLIPLP